MAQHAAAAVFSLKRATAASVLRYAWDTTAFTASDAMSATGLTRSTVISLCDSLVDAGWLSELEDSRAAGQAYRKGRPARRYSLRADAGIAIGVDAGQHQLTAIVADLRGNELSRVQERLVPDDLAADERIAKADAVVDEALRVAGGDPSAVQCITVGVPAPTDAEGNSPEGQNKFWRRMNPGYAEHFRNRGWATVVENDANLAALAEGALGAGVGVTSYITLLSGERFGAGYVVDGQLIRGARGGAGELRLLSLVENVGSPDGIGALARDWARQARSDGTMPETSSLSGLGEDELDSRAVFRAAEHDDDFAKALLGRIASRLARICAILAGLLDIDRIVVAGAVAASIGTLLEQTAPRLAELTHPPAPELVASSLGSGVVSAGAVTRALSYTREHALDLSPLVSIGT